MKSLTLVGFLFGAVGAKSLPGVTQQGGYRENTDYRPGDRYRLLGHVFCIYDGKSLVRNLC
jgi:hypothetical protein